MENGNPRYALNVLTIAISIIPTAVIGHHSFATENQIELMTIDEAGKMDQRLTAVHESSN